MSLQKLGKPRTFQNNPITMRPKQSINSYAQAQAHLNSPTGPSSCRKWVPDSFSCLGKEDNHETGRSKLKSLFCDKNTWKPAVTWAFEHAWILLCGCREQELWGSPPDRHRSKMTKFGVEAEAEALNIHETSYLPDDRSRKKIARNVEK